MVARSEELSDLQMGLHRFEEKFHFPPRLVEVTNGLGGEVHAVGEVGEHQRSIKRQYSVFLWTLLSKIEFEYGLISHKYVEFLQ